MSFIDPTLTKHLQPIIYWPCQFFCISTVQATYRRRNMIVKRLNLSFARFLYVIDNIGLNKQFFSSEATFNSTEFVRKEILRYQNLRKIISQFTSKTFPWVSLPIRQFFLVTCLGLCNNFLPCAKFSPFTNSGYKFYAKDFEMSCNEI